MSRTRKITLLVVLTVFSLGTYIVANAYRTWRRLPEAYAAWDTGTLLVEYMKVEGRWPSSWQDLSEFATGDPAVRQFTLYGTSRAEWPEYVAALPRLVAVDWSLDPRQPNVTAPVTRASGGASPVLWDGGDPNRMVRDHLSAHVGVLPAAPADRSPQRMPERNAQRP
jgi:hypothetical protein